MMKIGQLAKTIGCSSEAIRFYENSLVYYQTGKNRRQFSYCQHTISQTL